MVTAADLRHLRPVKALSFPASDPEWEMGQSITHVLLCQLLHHVLAAAIGDRGTVGCDQFVYFQATDPTRKCSPDAFIKLGVAPTRFSSWKVWEHGAPELCVEVLSPSDTHEKLTFDEKLERYAIMGIAEVVAFNVDAPAGARLRVWDHIDGDLVERLVEGETTPCLPLGLHWVVVPSDAPTGEALSAALRLARDPRGEDLLLTRGEQARLHADEAARHAEAAEQRANAADAEIERLRAEIEKLRR